MSSGSIGQEERRNNEARAGGLNASETLFTPVRQRAQSSTSHHRKGSVRGRTNSDSYSTESTTSGGGLSDEHQKGGSVYLLFLRAKGFADSKVRLVKRRFPLLGQIMDKAEDVFHRLPPKVRVAGLMAFVLWKFIVAFFVLKMILMGNHAIVERNLSQKRATQREGDRLKGVRGSSLPNLEQQKDPMDAASVAVRAPRVGGGDIGEKEGRPLQLLYIVTALSEFNTGDRKTRKGQDRLKEVLLPVLKNGVQSMISPPYNYEVDVYLVLGFELKPERKTMIKEFLPDGVGLEVWDNAIPLAYVREKDHSDALQQNTRALARQHRFVVKDKLHNYDFFVAFEDDMLITGEHVDHFITMSNELERLRDGAPELLNDGTMPESQDPQSMKFYGQMTKLQMSRMIPGFIRVEVLLDEETHGAQTRLDPIAVDLEFPVKGKPGEHEERHIDPRPCCQVPNMEPVSHIPPDPTSDKVIIWETAIKGLSVRQLAGSRLLDWVVLEPGPGKRLKPEEFIGGYWSGREGAFGDEPKPTPGMPQFVAQQGGWMATRKQLIQLDEDRCPGGFFPPYDEPNFAEDGHVRNNVEFWSGGWSLFSGVKGGCNMQRVISLDPDHFSRHLIYHTANNKQRQIALERHVKADTLFGQLNSVRKAAEKAIM